MKRKSPIRHKVSAHLRNRRPVHSYVRGNGLPPRLFRHRRVLEGSDVRRYTVEFSYLNGETEIVKTTSSSPIEAMVEADELRKYQSLRPTKVVVKNLLGQIVGRLAAIGVGGVKRAVEEYRKVREKAKVGEEARKEELEEQKELTALARERRLQLLRRKAAAGDTVAQRRLEKLGISW